MIDEQKAAGNADMACQLQQGLAQKVGNVLGGYSRKHSSLTWEIRRVANGFMVMPARFYGDATDTQEVHVFTLWSEASKFIGDQFRQETR